MKQPDVALPFKKRRIDSIDIQLIIALFLEKPLAKPVGLLNSMCRQQLNILMGRKICIVQEGEFLWVIGGVTGAENTPLSKSQVRVTVTVTVTKTLAAWQHCCAGILAAWLILRKC